VELLADVIAVMAGHVAERPGRFDKNLEAPDTPAHR
jgi:hypothetical protein